MLVDRSKMIADIYNFFFQICRILSSAGHRVILADMEKFKFRKVPPKVLRSDEKKTICTLKENALADQSFGSAQISIRLSTGSDLDLVSYLQIQSLLVSVLIFLCCQIWFRISQYESSTLLESYAEICIIPAKAYFHRNYIKLNFFLLILL